MPLFFWRRKAEPVVVEQPTTVPQNYRDVVIMPKWEKGRRYLEDVPYMMPKDLEEISRLDFQHYAFRATLKGNYMTPLQHPENILDVGCGTGQWAYEMCQEFPSAQVVGLDLEDSAKLDRPANYQFVQENVLDGFAFPDNSFDFIHQRLMVTALPLTSWPVVVSELVRITRPGGWIELLETGNEFKPLTPATARLFKLAASVAGTRGIDVNGQVARSLDKYLLRAGLQNVQHFTLEIPVGSWAGRVGMLMAKNLQAGFGTMRAMSPRFNLAESEFDTLLAQMQQEWEQNHSVYNYVLAYGQKSGG